MSATSKAMCWTQAGRAFVAAHFGLVGQFEKGEHVAAARVEEDVHVGVGLAGRRHLVLGEGELNSMPRTRWYQSTVSFASLQR